ncbi:MAG: type 2 isopentenyl-diphosphate Delta-isomerase [Myxococcota bacterium]
MSPPDNPNSDSGIRQRKVDHIELCTREEVEYRLTTTHLEHVRLLHQSLPEVSLDDIDLTTPFVGRTLSAPVSISGMTGGANQARHINRQLAQLAQRNNIAFGVGSMRAMLIDPSLIDTYAVRDVAPDIALLANIGAVQATSSSTAQLRDLVQAIDADALCIHLNPAQEMIQEGGDRDFRGNLAAIARLVEELDLPIIAKETGCGISPQTAAQLVKAGVRWVDVSGAGGTTWVGVEALRARPGRRAVGEDFWEWGIPTAASIHFAAHAGLTPIASGGLRNGHDVARAIALGAHIGSMALPFLRAITQGGLERAQMFLDRVIDGIRTACLLTGSDSLDDLKRAPRFIAPPLQHWMALSSTAPPMDGSL